LGTSSGAVYLYSLRSTVAAAAPSASLGHVQQNSGGVLNFELLRMVTLSPTDQDSVTRILFWYVYVCAYVCVYVCMCVCVCVVALVNSTDEVPVTAVPRTLICSL